MMPSRRLIGFVLVWACLGACIFVWPRLLSIWWIIIAALGCAALFDALYSFRSPDLRITRSLQGVWPVDVWNNVQITIHNESSSTASLELFDDYPTAWQLEGLPFSTRVTPENFKTITYRLRPTQRGDAQFGAPHLKMNSQLGLWQFLYRIGETSSVKVFPDFSTLLGNSLFATDRRSPTAGALRKRRRGEGTDFRQLREYRQGDSLRAIDWKATARQQKPITREYQEERDQQVVFLLDTGRRMLAQDGVTSHFDHALNAVLTLSFVAQKQGDAVGLMSFGGETRWLQPHKGRAGLDRMLAGVYDLQAHEVAPDYTLAASALLNKLSKRAFVVLITNLRDEDDQAMRSACELLSTKHLVMCASLREKSLDSALATPVVQFNDALRYTATAHYLQQRQEAIKRLGIRATHLIDITPEQLSAALVNRYFDVKESGML